MVVSKKRREIVPSQFFWKGENVGNLADLVTPIIRAIKNKEERLETCSWCLWKEGCNDEGHPDTFWLTEDYRILVCAMRARDKLNRENKQNKPAK